MVRTVLSVDTGAEAGAGLLEAEPAAPLTTITFCLELTACWALASAATSSSWSGTGVSAWVWPGWYLLMCLDRSPL